jgi:AraC-like DNA-binding protein
MPDDPTEPLKAFSILRTDDLAAASELLRSHYGVEITASNAEQFFARTNFAQLPNLAISFCGNMSPLSATIPRSTRVLVHLSLRGKASLRSGAHHVEIDEGEAFVCSPGCVAQLEFGAGLEQLILRIPQAMIDRTMGALTGYHPRGPIEFEPALDTSDPHYAGFRELLMLLAGRLEPGFSAWPSATLAQLEQACVTSFLHCSRHNLRRLLQDAPLDHIPIPVLHAEHYVQNSGDGDDVTVEDMANAAHVSVSTLTRAFLKHRGYSPSAFVKRVRLSRAKALLESGAATTVVGVALRCGFANPSRFANDYRTAFGESPTETLRRCRVGPAPDMQKY